MSRNAYRIIRIVTAKSPSFNLPYHDELVNILQESANSDDSLNSYGAGVVDILDEEFKEVKDKLEEVIDGLENTKTCQPERKEKAKCYRKVLAEMEREIAKEGYISYEIY